MGKRKSAMGLDPKLPIFQLKVTLDDIDPPIWRRFQVDDCFLDELHQVIQVCMGWEDDHMYAFAVGGKEIAHGNPSGDSRQARVISLSRLVEQGNSVLQYTYDFGDDWKHVVEIEQTLPAEDDVRYPRCIEGQRACPPEDCGGVWRYADLVEAIRDPEHEDDEDSIMWLDEDFDPEAFALEAANEQLESYRPFFGKRKRRYSEPPRFSVGDEVRVRPGVVSPDYPDIPLGGWAGTVDEVAYLTPPLLLVEWNEQTLENVHPVVEKRCKRDDIDFACTHLEEKDLEPDPGGPVSIEQPTEIIAKPLSKDNQDDRVRVAFGLTSDDPLPPMERQMHLAYYEYLKASLSFPFRADYDHQGDPPAAPSRNVTVTGMFDEFPVDDSYGAMCKAEGDGRDWKLPVTQLDFPEDDRNAELVGDYAYWFYEAASDPRDDADFEDDDDFDDDELDESEFDVEWEDDFDHEKPAPIVVEKRTGRNEPCPCGSGKKYKKCCLRKPSTPV